MTMLTKSWHVFSHKTFTNCFKIAGISEKEVERVRDDEDDSFAGLDDIEWGHPLSTYAKFSEKLTFLTPRYGHVRVRIRG